MPGKLILILVFPVSCLIVIIYILAAPNPKVIIKGVTVTHAGFWRDETKDLMKLKKPVSIVAPSSFTRRDESYLIVTIFNKETKAIRIKVFLTIETKKCLRELLFSEVGYKKFFIKTIQPLAQTVISIPLLSLEHKLYGPCYWDVCIAIKSEHGHTLNKVSLKRVIRFGFRSYGPE